MTNETSAKETGQTGQEPIEERQTKRAYFEIAADDQGNWNWVLWSSNGQAMCVNARPYARRNDCTAGIKSVMRTAPTASKIVIAHET